MTICDIIREVFESEEMKDYLCENTDKIDKFDIKEMIAGSPMITLQRKLEMFEELAESEDLDGELAEAEDERERESIIWNSYAEIVKYTRDAVTALNDTAKPAVFLVKTIICWDDEKDSYDEEEIIPFTSYEKAAEYIKAQEEIYDEDLRLWFDVEKWEKDESGNLNYAWSYLVVKGQIYFCSSYNVSHHNECIPNPDVNLPIPFLAGDIVEVHELPFARKRHVILLDIDDNCDCCAVWQAYVTEDGFIRANAFKHGHVFDKCWWTTSPLFRVKKFQGTLDSDEEVLYRIKEFMKKIPETDRRNQLFEIFEYISDNDIHSRAITEEYLNSVREKVL